METNVIKKLKQLNLFLFTPRDLRNIFDLSGTQIANLLQRMRQKDLVYQIQKGKYLVTGFDSASQYSVYTVASNIYTPSYVSFISALSFWELTDQLTKTIFVATVVSKPDLKWQNAKLKFVKLAKKRFFGYQKKQEQSQEYFIAEPEKAIIDCLFLPQYSGGIPVIFESLQNLEPLDTQKLIDYAKKMNTKVVLKRIGFLLDKIGIDIFSKLKGKMGTSYTVLDPSHPKKGKYNKKWKLIINHKL